MDPTDEYGLSFYQECGDLDKEKNIKLVRHIETGSVYVKKEMYDYDLSVFRVLKERRFAGIPKILECVEDAESHTLTVIEEFINGKTLRAVLDSEGTLPEDWAVRILKSICDTLEPLHKCDPPIVHRDIKPENIVLTGDSSLSGGSGTSKVSGIAGGFRMTGSSGLYVLDFDASRPVREGQTRDTELIGTRKYAAPEQYGYSQSDPRTDIYAIGKVGLEMLTGSTEIPTGKITDPLIKILVKCTSMDPKDRFRNVSELNSALYALNSFDPLGLNTNGTFSRYALPGFRSNKLWRKILAAALYIGFIIWSFAVGDTSGYPLGTRILAYVSLFTMVLCLVLFYGNYLDVHRHLPLMKSKRLPVRITGYIIYTYVIVYGLRIFFDGIGLPHEI